MEKIVRLKTDKNELKNSILQLIFEYFPLSFPMITFDC
jgi:hypothetical protein